MVKLFFSLGGVRGGLSVRIDHFVRCCSESSIPVGTADREACTFFGIIRNNIFVLGGEGNHIAVYEDCITVSIGNILPLQSPASLDCKFGSQNKLATLLRIPVAENLIYCVIVGFLIS